MLTKNNTEKINKSGNNIIETVFVIENLFFLFFSLEICHLMSENKKLNFSKMINVEKFFFFFHRDS